MAYQERKPIMSLVPAFELGLWNAWILMVLLLAAGTVPLCIGSKAEKRGEGDPTEGELHRTTRIAQIVTHMVIMPFTLLCSILLPLKLGTPWFFVGLPVYLLGLAMALMFSISFSTAPLGEPMTKGVYAISRHPGYFAFFLGLVGIGVACASWVFLLCAVVWIVSWHFGVIEEERILLERYEDAYREYMHRTPRWIGFPRAD
jgi:protein-S-isoprenylcysteine O-methyltransferase Ste14